MENICDYGSLRVLLQYCRCEITQSTVPSRRTCEWRIGNQDLHMDATGACTGRSADLPSTEPGDTEGQTSVAIDQNDFAAQEQSQAEAMDPPG